MLNARCWGAFVAKYRILSLDGGGSWALIQVMALQALYSENTTGQNVLKDFDLVAAKSGGSITLGGLIENLSLKALLNTYFLDESKRRKIFSPVSPLENIENAVYNLIHIAPKYSTADKLVALRQQLPSFGSAPIASIPGRIAQSVGKSPDFLICAFDYDTRRAAFFRSNLKSDAASFASPVNPTLAEAINASSTAPVKFFDSPAGIASSRYWDGAIAGYNNPVLGAVVEALANGIPGEDIQVLSIGTASVRLPIVPPGSASDPGLAQTAPPSNPPNDLQELAGSIIDDPPDAATFIAYIALRQPIPTSSKPAPTSGNIVRMNPMVQPVLRHDGSWGPPTGLSLADFGSLVQLDMDAIQQADVLKIHNFCIQWIADKVPNQPIRANSNNFVCEIGHAAFSQARAAWLSLKQS
jgi:hypothetical protein